MKTRSRWKRGSGFLRARDLIFYTDDMFYSTYESAHTHLFAGAIHTSL